MNALQRISGMKERSKEVFRFDIAVSVKDRDGDKFLSIGTFGAVCKLTADQFADMLEAVAEGKGVMLCGEDGKFQAIPGHRIVHIAAEILPDGP